MEQETDKKIRAEILAERVKLLFGFCAELIPDKDLLFEVMEVSDKRASDALSMAPILGAFGMDWEEAEHETKIRQRRACALYELIDAIEETEQARLEFREKQAREAKGRAELSRILGI